MHIAGLSRRSPGIVQQMEWEQEAARSLEISWDTKLLLPGSSLNGETDLPLKFRSGRPNRIVQLFSWFFQRRRFFQELQQASSNYDLILLRYSVHDFFQLRFLKSSNCPVGLVHHTIEKSELLLDGRITGRLRSFVESKIGLKANSLAAGQIAVTREILESIDSTKQQNSFSIVYPNGIRPHNFELVDRRREIPEYIFVASHFQPWHGLDRLISAVKSSEAEIVVHVIGKLDDNLIRACKHDPRFRIHGVKTYQEIQEIASTAWLGIASLGMDRNGLTQGSTLKVREYLDLGLPVVADHLDVFGSDWKYFRRVETEPSELIRQLIEFSNEVRGVSRNNVRSAATPYIEKEILLHRLHSSLIDWRNQQLIE